jgi:tetratricopeptide (TPR) repeat protein
MLSRIFCSLLFLLAAVAGDAQMPSMKTGGKESADVYLQKLEVEVSINGILATTVWTMTFRNSSGRVLEGELNFPLPAGVNVSHYALDINGKMREAVPVQKEKATQVFELTERRRIDPGLLEKVEGNTFRTRIYPIPAGGVRTVRIGYEQELAWEEESDLRYRLPLAFHRNLAIFSIHIRVTGTAVKPQIDEGGDALQFQEWQNSWSAKKEWTNYRADQPVAIRIPQLPGMGTVQMQAAGNHYFFTASVFPAAKSIDKPLPRRVALIWDASLSGEQRDHTRELQLLGAYFSRLGNAEVSLVPFRDVAGPALKFDLRSGDWKALREELEKMVYDGGTQFGCLNLAKVPADEYLLVSDGHSNFGSDKIVLGDKPVYPIAASAGADFPFLSGIARASGGELVDLSGTPVDKAFEVLCKQPLHFLGVRPAEGVGECYPSLPTAVKGALTVVGMVNPAAKTVVLQFGYGKKVTMEEPVVLDLARQAAGAVDPARPGAEGVDPARPGAEGVDLGRVWAQKKIAELEERYADNAVEIRHLGRSYGIVTRNTSLVVLENIQDYIAYEIEPPVELRAEYDQLLKGRQEENRWKRRQVADQSAAYFDELFSWWKGGVPAVGKESKREEEETSLFTPPRDVRDHAVRAEHAPVSQATSQSSNLDEVVVVGYATAKRKELTGSMTSVQGAPDPRGGDPEQGSFKVGKAETSTLYLDELKAAAPAGRYALYLRLRKEYGEAPVYYFHVAEFFLASGEKMLGLRILSNIAEIDVENYELYKMMAYKLKETGEAGAACAAFRKILEWRPFEPQSYRDYGLALEDAGLYQNALDTLYLAMTKNYDVSVSGMYPGIEETLLPEINELIARHKDRLKMDRIPSKLVAALPVDMRVVLNWNRASTDIDLWVTDPDNERCYYGHRTTAMGGRISHDFTQGLGPEQFLLKKAEKGRYKVEVNYYGDSQVRLAGETTVLVEVYTHYGTAQQQRSLVTLQMKPGSNGAVYVGDFEF